MRELLELEEQGWRTLSTAGDAARKFYASVLREDAVMLFPGGMRIAGRERILESLSAQPWNSYRLEDVAVVELTAESACILYKATAQRKDEPPYTALISTTYVRDGKWQLVLHQQTPI